MGKGERGAELPGVRSSSGSGHHLQALHCSLFPLLLSISSCSALQGELSRFFMKMCSNQIPDIMH